MSKPILHTMSLRELEQLAQRNPTDRGLLADIRSQFVRRTATKEAQAVTKMILALSSQPSAPKTEAVTLDRTMKLPELQRYFRHRVFNDVAGLKELQELLKSRDGQASQTLADEVSARIRQIQPGSKSGSGGTAGTDSATPILPASTMDQGQYSRLFHACQAGTATPDQVRLLITELDRRKFPVNHPIRAALQQGLGPVTSTPTAPPIVSKAGPVYENPIRISPERKAVYAPPSNSPGIGLTGNSAWLEERRKARETRRTERAPTLSMGFIEIKPRPTRQMVEVYLGSPERLIATVAKMKRVAAKPPSYQGITDAELSAAMDRLSAKTWKDESERRRDRRLLPYLLLSGSPANVSHYGVDLFLKELDQDDRLISVKEIIQRYFHADFEHYPKQRKALGNWIQQRLQKVDLNKCKRAWVHQFHENQSLFGPEPVRFATAFLPPARADWEDWDNLEIPTQSWLYSEALAEGVRSAMRNQEQEARDKLLNRLQRTVATDITGSNTRIVQVPVESLDVRRKCIEAALMEHVSQKTLTPDTALIAFALDVLKDPRQKDSAHWYGVNAEATALMQQWLSIEDLEMFFGELADDADEKSRVQYWTPFVLNRMVSFSRIFLGESVIRRKKRKVENYLRTGRYGRLFGPGSDEVCAFVLRIKDAIIVEFSKVGNACYIYDARRFDPKLFNLPKATVKDLKSPDAAEKLSHMANWPARFDEVLYRDYNIRRPTK